MSRNHKIITTIVCALIFSSTWGFGADTPVLKPRFDERVELLGIVYRLAGAPEYQSVALKSYDDDINQHFAKFKFHPAVLAAKVSRNTAEIAYNAVANYAIHISLKNGHVVFQDSDSEITLELLEFRWKKKTAESFAKLLDDFYVKSDFHEFYVAHQELYEKTERRIAQITDKIDYAWFQSFYGSGNSSHFKIILNFPSGNTGYGAACRYKDEHEESFAFVGVDGPDANYNEDGFTSWVIHEFNHYFCNTLVDQHFKELQDAAGRHFALVADKMKEQAYPLPKIMLFEYLTRACEIKYLRDHDKNEHANALAKSYCNLGFLLIDDFVEALARYEWERDKYPTLNDFMPEIAKLLNEKITDEFVAKYENRPKVVSTNPPIGSTDVDPTLTEISVTFDQSMQDSCACCSLDNGQTFPKIREAKPFWSEDQKTFSFKVELEANKSYNIWINTILEDDFRNVDDIPVEPVLFNFTTGDGKSNP